MMKSIVNYPAYSVTDDGEVWSENIYHNWKGSRINMPIDRFKSIKFQKQMKESQHAENLEKWNERNREKPWFKLPREAAARAWLEEVKRRGKTTPEDS